jgi:site-specific DNA-adenine methylase
MRPFFPFYGSKWNMARYYERPQFEKVCEPFAGGAGYSTFYDVQHARLLDADPIITGLWRYLIAASAEEIMALPTLPNVGDHVDDYDLPDPAKWLIGFWLNRGSATPKKSRTAYSARTDKAQLNWGERAKERIANQLEGIRDWRVVGSDYAAVPDAEVTWFIDPPYVDKGKFYRVSFNDYDALATWSRSRRGQVIVCEGAEANWLPFRPLGEFKTSSGFARELVWP